MDLRRFQTEFVAKATAPGVDVAALSMPRGNGKSTLAAHIGARIMSPGDPLFRAGTESVIVARTLEQGRIVFRFVRAMLDGDSDYRFSDSMDSRCRSYPQADQNGRSRFAARTLAP